MSRLEETFERTIGREPTAQGDKGTGLLGRLATIEHTIGDHGDPILKRPASGLVGGYLTLSTAVEDLTKELKLDRESRDTWSKRLGTVVMAVVIAAAVGAANLAWHWAATLHH